MGYDANPNYICFCYSWSLGIKANRIINHIDQIIRPTGLIDPPVEIRPAKTQVDDLMQRGSKGQLEKDYRVLATTLTKKMAEDLNRIPS